MANMIVVLVQDIVMLLLDICAAMGNGFILYLIFTNSKLRRNENLYLIMTLTLVDFILAITALPYIILLLSQWGMTVDYPALPMVILVMPLIITIKISQILDCAIAIDRLTAIQWPVAYKLRNRAYFTGAFLLLGILLAAVDVIYAFMTSEIKQTPHCPVAGCFLSQRFSGYAGVSNLIIDAVALTTTVLMLFKVYTLKSSHTNLLRDENESSIFKRANKAAVGVLVCSTVTIVGPSLLQSIGNILNFAPFQQVGPFVALGLTLNAAANPFIYGFRHRDIRAAMPIFQNASRAVSVHATTSMQR